MTVVFKSYEIVLIRVFLHTEFISALKTEIKYMVFEKYAKMKKKNYYHSFLFSFFIFSKSFKQIFLIPTESCFLDGKKSIIAKLVDINFSTDCVENR